MIIVTAAVNDDIRKDGHSFIVVGRRGALRRVQGVSRQTRHDCIHSQRRSPASLVPNRRQFDETYSVIGVRSQEVAIAFHEPVNCTVECSLDLRFIHGCHRAFLDGQVRLRR